MSKLDDVLARAKSALEFEERGDALDKEAVKKVFLDIIDETVMGLGGDVPYGELTNKIEEL